MVTVMNYLIYELTFRTGVHFGENVLSDSESTFCADTLFSALYMEALKTSPDEADRFLRFVAEDKLLWSDALPRIHDTVYLPKPYMPIEGTGPLQDTSVRKALKAMRHVPIGLFDRYMAGGLLPEQIKSTAALGKRETRSATAVRGVDEPLPYHIGVFRFNEECGLDILISYQDEENFALFDALMKSLSGSCIGGKRASGVGRFDYQVKTVGQDLVDKLTAPHSYYMSLSVCLPDENELASVLEGSYYMIRKRSGFVLSETYAPESRRKKDLYVFAAGSCFSRRFSGSVADVSNRGTHPVYRYAKPLWLGVLA